MDSEEQFTVETGEVVDALAKDGPEPGMHPELGFEDYAAAPGVNVSFLKVFKGDCPAKARYGVRKETPALVKGSLIHCAILEADYLERRYQPTKLDRRGTNAWKDAELAAGGRELVKQADMDMALYVRDSVFAHETARTLLHGLNTTEQSFFWIDPATGLKCKGRADALHTTSRIALDVKSAISAHRDEFRRAIYKYKYHWQDAHYSNGIRHADYWTPEAFIFIVVEKEPPFVTACYEVDREDKVRARDIIATAMREVSQCMASDVWPAYGTKIETIALRDWDRRAEEELI